jgi:hypothetical protein
MLLLLARNVGSKGKQSPFILLPLAFSAGGNPVRGSGNYSAALRKTRFCHDFDNTGQSRVLLLVLLCHGENDRC